jgi:hypothetical protein
MAMRSGSVEQAREVLETDPEALRDLYFDCNFEPPLCWAVRMQLETPMIQLLLDHGADAHATDTRGRNALTLLSAEKWSGLSDDWANCSPPQTFAAWAENVMNAHQHRSLKVAQMLVDAGAMPGVPDARDRLPEDEASAAGNELLARYWRSCLEVRACKVIWQASAGSGNPCDRTSGHFSSLTTDMTRTIISFLVPEKLLPE